MADELPPPPPLTVAPLKVLHRRRPSPLTPTFPHHTASHLLSPTFLPVSATGADTYRTYMLRYTIPASTHFRVFLNGVGVGGGGAAEGSLSGAVVLTRVLLEQLGTLEIGAVMEYLRRGLEWVVEGDDGMPLELGGVEGLKVRVASAEVNIYDPNVKPKWEFYGSVVDGRKGGIK